MKSIRYRWVYKVKYNANSFVNRYKARLVAKGYVQQHDIDWAPESMYKTSSDCDVVSFIEFSMCFITKKDGGFT